MVTTTECWGYILIQLDIRNSSYSGYNIGYRGYNIDCYRRNVSYNNV